MYSGQTFVSAASVYKTYPLKEKMSMVSVSNNW